QPAKPVPAPAQADKPATPEQRRKKIEIPPAAASENRPQKPARSEHAEQTFRVKEAEAGYGFGVGAVGRLRIFALGISFSTEAKGRTGWTIPWSDFVSAARDDGIWDAGFPIALTERGGRRRYIVRLDSNGRYLSGEPILSAIAAVRRAAHKPEDKTSPP